MPLQSSGSISMSQIKTELLTVAESNIPATNYGLRVLSSTAGKSTPDSISEFYGYSASGGGGAPVTYTAYSQTNTKMDTNYFEQIKFTVYKNNTVMVQSFVFGESLSSFTFSAGDTIQVVLDAYYVAACTVTAVTAQQYLTIGAIYSNYDYKCNAEASASITFTAPAYDINLTGYVNPWDGL